LEAELVLKNPVNRIVVLARVCPIDQVDATQECGHVDFMLSPIIYVRALDRTLVLLLARPCSIVLSCCSKNSTFSCLFSDAECKSPESPSAGAVPGEEDSLKGGGSRSPLPLSIINNAQVHRGGWRSASCTVVE
jgi:hypothetical protein